MKPPTAKIQLTDPGWYMLARRKKKKKNQQSRKRCKRRETTPLALPKPVFFCPFKFFQLLLKKLYGSTKNNMGQTRAWKYTATYILHIYVWTGVGWDTRFSYETSQTHYAHACFFFLELRGRSWSRYIYFFFRMQLKTSLLIGWNGVWHSSVHKKLCLIGLTAIIMTSRGLWGLGRAVVSSQW